MNRISVYNKTTNDLKFVIENKNWTQVQLLTSAINQMSHNFLAKAESDADTDSGAEEAEAEGPEPGSEAFIASEDVSARIKPAIAILKDLMQRAEQKRVEESSHQAALESIVLESQNAVKLDDLSGQSYVTMDGDDIGNKVAQAQFSDDEAKVKEMSRKIDAGMDLFERWSQKYGGAVIEAGGDEGQVKVPKTALDHIEEFRTQYKDMVGATVSVGVGDTISESIQARQLAKLRGKNQTVFYDDTTDKELETRLADKNPECDGEAQKIQTAGVLQKMGIADKEEFEQNKLREAEYQKWLRSKVTVDG